MGHEIEAWVWVDRGLTVLGSAGAAVLAVNRWVKSTVTTAVAALQKELGPKVESLEKQVHTMKNNDVAQQQKLAVLETRLDEIKAQQTELKTETKQQTALLNRIAGALGAREINDGP